MKKIISTQQAPAAIGPYSQATTAGGLIFLSGQLPADPSTNEIISGGIEEQTKQVLNNLSNLLKASGSDLSKVLKTTVFLKDINDFEVMNKVYKEFFGIDNFPARSAFQVVKLPKNALVEIEAIALA